MCLSVVYKNEVNDANLLAKNVADIKVDGGKILYVKNGTFSDDGSVITSGRDRAIIVFSLGY